MSAYLIGYDLDKPGQNYPNLFSAIKNCGTNWWHCLDSTWIILSNKTTAQVRDHLTPHIDANDKLLVVLYGGDWASYGFSAECGDWLKANL